MYTNVPPHGKMEVVHRTDGRHGGMYTGLGGTDVDTHERRLRLQAVLRRTNTHKWQFTVVPRGTRNASWKYY